MMTKIAVPFAAAVFLAQAAVNVGLIEKPNPPVPPASEEVVK